MLCDSYGFFIHTLQEVESDSTEPVTPTKESSEDGPEEEPPSVPSSPSGVNRRTSVLFTKKAGALFKVCISIYFFTIIYAMYFL